jgi:ParB-like chromosome segregation protein Spo0J
MQWDDDSLIRAGVLFKGEEDAATIVRYVAGVVKRERERLARIVRGAGVDPSVAQALLDEDDDARIFRWGAHVDKVDQAQPPRPRAA